jgi:outer membrane receptor protein involved in Fe transport
MINLYRLGLCVFSLLFLLNFQSVAQPPQGGGGRPAAGRGQMNIGRFYGKIVDNATNKGIDAASVQLVTSRMDSTTRARVDTIIGGMLTTKTGDFSIENLPVFGQFRLKVTAIGYKTVEQTVAFDVRGAGRDMMSAADKDLGNIKLAQDAQVLESVTVSGSRPMMQMGIDRKIFNVEKSITSAGGTAVDVMRNVPSINVDLEGNITLRNSAPQIFVDGRPTSLTLEQIPADAIESVELITNPSAKFDASGGQSGIVNIVLKKQRKLGYNGGVRTGVDSRGRVQVGGDLNVRQGKVNVFVSGMLNQRKSKSWGETERLNLFDDPNTTIFQRNDNVFTGGFAFTRFGFDYFLDNRNTLSVSQNIAGGNFNFDNVNYLQYDTLSSSQGFETQYRNTLGENRFRNYNTNISFKHLFPKPGKELTADVTLNQNRNRNESDIRFRSFNDMQQLNPKNPERLQQIMGSGRNRMLIVQTDYINPINKNMKWEAGLRAQVRTFESNQFNFLDGVSQPRIDNEFEYTDYIYAAYATFSQKVRDKLSYQLGLRAESSSYDGEQIGKETYTNEFPLSLFPSVFVTYNVKENQDLQLNYSRKINRPNFFQLMPNRDFSDLLNLQTGNPDLRPEFTHGIELSYQITYGERNNSFLASLFGRYTDDLIARYQSLQPVGDTIAFVSSWINASTAYASGLELVFRNNLTKWWEMNLNTNVYYSRINGSNVVSNLENERTSSFSKLNNTFRISKGWSVQLSGDYQTRSALPVSTSNSGGGGGRGFGGGFMGGTPSTTQGYIDANYGVDIGIRKEFKIRNNQATISLNVNDVLRTRRYFIHSESADAIQDEWRRRDPQIVRLNFNLRFGKFDVALFKRRNNRADGDAGQGAEAF